MPVTVKIIDFWDVVPSNLLTTNNYFGGTCFVCLQCRRVIKTEWALPFQWPRPRRRSTDWWSLDRNTVQVTRWSRCTRNINNRSEVGCIGCQQYSVSPELWFIPNFMSEMQGSSLYGSVDWGVDLHATFFSTNYIQLKYLEAFICGLFKEWKRGDCQKKLWNGAHQEEENEVDLNLPGRKGLEEKDWNDRDKWKKKII